MSAAQVLIIWFVLIHTIKVWSLRRWQHLNLDAHVESTQPVGYQDALGIERDKQQCWTWWYQLGHLEIRQSGARTAPTHAYMHGLLLQLAVLYMFEMVSDHWSIHFRNLRVQHSWVNSIQCIEYCIQYPSIIVYSHCVVLAFWRVRTKVRITKLHVVISGSIMSIEINTHAYKTDIKLTYWTMHSVSNWVV